ncbi:hypothetical protein AURDEDRAFT_128008 [Auricularia subglabra TFB-10046 SS5]|nr:hypothetical protein AURDEDRAFT_128008 [Auricularia subglabra TFB-10046 SS5]
MTETKEKTHAACRRDGMYRNRLGLPNTVELATEQTPVWYSVGGSSLPPSSASVQPETGPQHGNGPEAPSHPAPNTQPTIERPIERPIDQPHPLAHSGRAPLSPTPTPLGAMQHGDESQRANGQETPLSEDSPRQPQQVDPPNQLVADAQGLHDACNSPTASVSELDNGSDALRSSNSSVPTPVYSPQPDNNALSLRQLVDAANLLCDHAPIDFQHTTDPLLPSTTRGTTEHMLRPVHFHDTPHSRLPAIEPAAQPVPAARPQPAPSDPAVARPTQSALPRPPSSTSQQFGNRTAGTSGSMPTAGPSMQPPVWPRPATDTSQQSASRATAVSDSRPLPGPSTQLPSQAPGPAASALSAASSSALLLAGVKLNFQLLSKDSDTRTGLPPFLHTEVAAASPKRHYRSEEIIRELEPKVNIRERRT